MVYTWYENGSYFFIFVSNQSHSSLLTFVLSLVLCLHVRIGRMDNLLFNQESHDHLNKKYSCLNVSCFRPYFYAFCHVSPLYFSSSLSVCISILLREYAFLKLFNILHLLFVTFKCYTECILKDFVFSEIAPVDFPNDSGYGRHSERRLTFKTSFKN